MAAGTGGGGYTLVTDAEMRALAEAGASGTQVLAYMQLARFYRDPEHPSRCWVSAQEASERLGIRPDVFSRALRDLTRRRFTTPGGHSLPVLERVGMGHRGRSAVYDNNVHAHWVRGRMREF